jgi:hypothetical protein
MGTLAHWRWVAAQSTRVSSKSAYYADVSRQLRRQPRVHDANVFPDRALRLGLQPLATTNRANELMGSVIPFPLPLLDVSCCDEDASELAERVAMAIDSFHATHPHLTVRQILGAFEIVRAVLDPEPAGAIEEV